MRTSSHPVGLPVAAGLVGTAVCIIVLFRASDAEACMHPSVDAGAEAVSQTDQSALIYHNGDRQHLYLSAGVSTDRDLSKLGWVVPVPSTPDQYGTADPALFDALGEWMNLRRIENPAALRARGGERIEETPLEVGETVDTGPYQITPLNASGEKGLEALREWFDENDLQAPESTEPARYYVERDWTFLAVRIDPKEDADTLELDGGLPPVHLSFESDRAVYPLKFEGEQGQFSVRIYVVTPRRVPLEAFEGVKQRGFFVAMGGGFRAERGWAGDLYSDPDAGRTLPVDFAGEVRVDHSQIRPDEAPEPLVTTLEQAGAFEAVGDTATTPYINTLYAPVVNAGAADPATWDEDLAIPPMSSDDTLSDAMSTTKTIGELVRKDDTSSEKHPRQPTGAPEDVGTPERDPAPTGCTGCGGCHQGGDPLGHPALVVLVGLTVVGRRLA